MIRGIRWRIVLTYLVLIVLALSIFGVYMLQFVEKVFMDNLQSQVKEETTLLATWVAPHLETYDTPGQKERVYDMISRTGMALAARVTLIDLRGNVMLDTLSDNESRQNQLDNPEVEAATNGSVGLHIRKVPYSAYNVLHLAVPVYGEHGPVAIMRMGVPLKGAHETLQALWGRIGMSLLIVAIVASLFGLRFAHGIAAPIEAITRSTRKIASGAFDERIHQRGRDELRVMADSINAMASRLSEQIEDLTQEKGKFEGILKHLVSGVIVVDRSGRVTLVNAAMERMIGSTAEELLQKWHWEGGYNFGLSAMIDEAILVGTAQKKEITLHKPVERTVEVHITPIFSNNGRIAGAIVLMHDVSEWRRLERMRSEFVANVSHELRTPITAVKGFSETLLDGALNDPEITRQFLQIIHDESERLKRLVTDLLELSKIESRFIVFQHEPFDIVKLSQRTVEKYAHQAEGQGLTLHLDLPQEPVMLEGDADRIAQVLINLIGNAIAYTPSGGEVRVSVAEVEDEVVLTVQDTGIGIPAEDLPRLFERFYRVDKARARRSGGTGLGLAIVKHILEGHHGHVEVKSEVGKGSQFVIYLPKKQSGNETAP
ncbi:two-component system histidine kinase PnpS [Tumebacillus lipolyticus]|uniref:histidine kinase n=1 Tax=Tumebacillus lipolyticus TaxID=1280370 RepID=A0ABW4ZXF9_9BACL